jgi:hypothetical protein
VIDPYCMTHTDGSAGDAPQLIVQACVRGSISAQPAVDAVLNGANLSGVEYVTHAFEPVVAFEIGSDWQFLDPETSDQVWMWDGVGGGELFFTNPSHVFDRSNPSELQEVPAPQNAKEWVSWFQRHPNLDTSKPVPVSVGGAPGKRIDVTATSMPENYPQDVCGEASCVPLYKGSTSESTIVSYEGLKDRFVVVDVGNETVVIDVAARADWFDEFLPKAQKVLNTV